MDLPAYIDKFTIELHLEPLAHPTAIVRISMVHALLIEGRQPDDRTFQVPPLFPALWQYRPDFEEYAGVLFEVALEVRLCVRAKIHPSVFANAARELHTYMS